MSLQVKTNKEATSGALQYLIDRKEGKIKSLKTPWPKFNSVYMNGLEWRWIVTIGGMSGSGKTSLLSQLEYGLLEHNQDQEFDILSFNFEMLAERLSARKFSNVLGKTMQQINSADMVSPDKNLNDADIEKLERYVEKSGKYPIYYVEKPGNHNEIQATIRKFAADHNCGTEERGLVVTLDHALLLKKMAGENERQSLINLATTFNELKKDYPKIMFVLLSQLNRNIESDERIQKKDLHFPRKGDLFGSEALYQFSDAVIIAHRPEILGIMQYGPQPFDSKGYMFLHHLKVRDGESLITRMVNDLKFNKLREV